MGNTNENRSRGTAAANASEADEAAQFRFLMSAEFDAATYARKWLVRHILACGQTSVMGGPRKALKTTLLVDLAISLGTATPFLGEFQVPNRCRVAIMSGESGEATLQETARRVAAAQGIALATADVFWCFQLPQLANAADLATLQQAVLEAKIDVLIIDPLYLALLASVGGDGPQASNLYQMGPLLMAVARTCLSVGCTPILAHHFRLQRADHYGEPQLEDLAFAGIQEFARQWVLLGRREKYEPGTGSHRLWLSVGAAPGIQGSGRWISRRG